MKNLNSNSINVGLRGIVGKPELRFDYSVIEMGLTVRRLEGQTRNYDRTEVVMDRTHNLSVKNIRQVDTIKLKEEDFACWAEPTKNN